MQETKNLERADIQGPLNDAITAKLMELNLAPTGDHARRVIRSVLRIGAKIALENGCPAPNFAEMCTEAFSKEATSQSCAPSPFIATTK